MNILSLSCSTSFFNCGNLNIKLIYIKFIYVQFILNINHYD